MKRKNADNAAIVGGSAAAVGGAGYAGVKDAGVRFDQAGWDLLNVRAGTKVPPTHDMKSKWAKSAKKKKLGLVAAGVGAGVVGAGAVDRQINKSAFGVEIAKGLPRALKEAAKANGPTKVASMKSYKRVLLNRDLKTKDYAAARIVANTEGKHAAEGIGRLSRNSNWGGRGAKYYRGVNEESIGRGRSAKGQAEGLLSKSAFGVEISKAKQQKEFKDYSRKERGAIGAVGGAALGGSFAAQGADAYLQGGKAGTKKVSSTFLGRPMETTVPTWEPNTIKSPIKAFKHGRKVKEWERQKANAMPDSAKPRYEKLKTMAERGSSEGEKSAFTAKVKDYEAKHGKPFTTPKPVANLAMKAPRTKIGLAGAAVGAAALGGAYAAPKQNKKKR